MTPPRQQTEPATTPAISGDSIINELLNETPDRAAGSPEAEDDLIAPEILFPEGIDDKGA